MLLFVIYTLHCYRLLYKSPLLLGVLKYLAATCTFRFSREGGISEAKLVKIPEKIKIGVYFQILPEK
jgi:hypothetical protein